MRTAQFTLISSSPKISIGTSGEVEQGKLLLVSAYHGLQSHVLLAACGEKELAYEHEGRGLFTTALLETLKNCAIDDLTYSAVLERIHLNKQNPHCEGFNQHRVLFDARVPAGRQVRHSVRIHDDGKYVIGAGLAQGISHGVEFTLYNDRKLSLGVVVVDNASAIEDFQTTVTTSVHLENASNFSSLLEETLRRIDANGNTPKYRLVKDLKEAKLEVAMENDLAVLEVLDQQLKRFGLSELFFKATLDRLTHALGAASHYYWYLDLTKKNNHIDTKDGVTVDFYLLRESEREYDNYGLPLLVPVEPGFCKRDPNMGTSNVIEFVVDPEALAGAPEAPLKRNGAFTIGYGPGGIAPFAYSLEEGQDVDVGYLKIFLATRPIDLSDIVQLSPFPTMNARSGVNEDARKARLNSLPLMEPTAPTDTWFTLDIPVVQRREEMPTVV
ncbi:hypothetical protein J3R83DRAFT_13411 [Lanmaoa asiatica]|nr:hypothetical protein J3R83DRAFT_13411 [Lanmaoa asiatica]